jgi:hypothetical protein
MVREPRSTQDWMETDRVKDVSGPVSDHTVYVNGYD